MTTVLLLADAAMVTAMTKQATTQDYHPEWVYLGSAASTSRSWPGATTRRSGAHSFGLATSPGGRTVGDDTDRRPVVLGRPGHLRRELSNASVRW